jgi:molecular chaperone DnaK (HSP70)
MSHSRYIVGIDLGTTNSAVAYVDTRGKARPSPDIRPFPVPQLVAAGEAAPRAMLPSFLYLVGEHELPPGAAALPWRDEAARIVGEFARVQGARVPSRLVSSAKSWLGHGGVDREAGILPWGAPKEVPRVSPVEASAAYLAHVRDAWNSTFAREDPRAKLEEQEVVLTVPASFDEAARELTVEAAKRAGLARLTLLEEPQAAFYCWIVAHHDAWQAQVRAGELILVCDVGGGTTDFSLITVVETPTGPGFRRVAVGDHLMLGGDNMDLALAHHIEGGLPGARLDTEQWGALRFACRTAKEKLLDDGGGQARWPVTIAGRGSRLIGGSLQAELSRDDVHRLVLDGFFPNVAADAEPSRGARLGVQEFGLPFVADPAVTRHLAAFLRRHRVEAAGPVVDGAAAGRPARPDAILFNGGALTPRILRDRVVDVVTSWFADAPDGGYRPRVLSNDSLDLAVAQGAAYYGVVRRGGGIRIGGGTARSFYVGFEGEATGATPWLCVVPRDAQEGEEVAVAGHDFELLMGRPVAFPLASSSVRPQDRPGDLVPTDPDSIRELPPLVGLMRVGRKAKAERVPVQLTAKVTEVGTIELWCRSRTDDRRWRLQIQLRGGARPVGAGAGAGAMLAAAAASTPDGELVLEQSELDAAGAAIREAFGQFEAEAPTGVSRLVKRLEEVLAIPRDRWPLSGLRSLWDALRDTSDARAKSPRHEARWLNLAGYSLRPGTGYPLDETRIKSLWPIFHAGVHHAKDVQCWAEWWILWRRVAAGLNRVHHEEIGRRLLPFLTPAKGGVKKPTRPKPEPHELAEMWRCAAALERLPAGTKEELGAALARELGGPRPAAPHAAWCLGRLGARVPLYGPANTAVPAAVAGPWAETLLTHRPATTRETADLALALALVGRVANDRARDLDPDLRARILARLDELGADEGLKQLVREYHELGGDQQGQALGDALPVGLRLLRPDGATGQVAG